MTDTLFATAEEIETLRGTVTRIRYAENGRAIVEIQVAASSSTGPDGKRRPWKMTALGSMVEPTIGQLYEFSGKVMFNDQYKNHQITFDSYRTILPTDHEGIFSYLVDVARWVGPATAKKLVDTFGSQTLTVIKEETQKVSELHLEGLTSERIEEMRKSLVENEATEAATIEVNNLLAGALGPATARKAIRKWGCNAPTLIKSNPFILTTLSGVGFLSADAVRNKIGLDPGDLRRHRAALVHVLSENAARFGNTFMPLASAIAETNKLVGTLRPEMLADCESDSELELGQATISLKDLSASERYIAHKLTDMLRLVDTRAEKEPSKCPAFDCAGLADDQTEAVKAFECSPVFALVGAPGTGKTYTVARIVDSLRKAGITVALAAPTGKAAKQMAVALGQTCGGNAVTIHSLLEPTVDEDSGEFYFQRDESLPLDCNVLVLDEVSMIDARLMRSLLKAVPATCRLLLVGDHYQLPSVGPGAVLRDLLRAGLPHFELKTIKRNAGLIVKACHAIKDGRCPTPAAKLDLDGGSNWRHIEAADPESIKHVIHTLISKTLPGLGIDKLWGQQLISPVNERGPLSCDALNELAQGLLNPGAVPVDKLAFRIGDKVVRCKNGNTKGVALPEEGKTEGVQDRGDGEIRVVNGDIGVVEDIDKRHITVKFLYPARRAFIRRTEHHLKLAYCLTCHKMQGSEVDAVVLPLHRSLARLPMVSREWLYTAVSRAKRTLITVGDLDALAPMVRRVGTNQRNTMLRQLFEKLNQPQPLELEL